MGPRLRGDDVRVCLTVVRLMKIVPFWHDAGDQPELVGDSRRLLEYRDQRVAGARMALPLRMGMFHRVGARERLDAFAVLREAAQQRRQIIDAIRHHVNDAGYVLQLAGDADQPRAERTGRRASAAANTSIRPPTASRARRTAG